MLASNRRRAMGQLAGVGGPIRNKLKIGVKYSIYYNGGGADTVYVKGNFLEFPTSRPTIKWIFFELQ